MPLTNATDAGPLQILIGTWTGDKGKDIAPEFNQGTEENAYREKIEFNPVRNLSNAEEQLLITVQYHQVVHRKRDNKQIHDQCGYWIWDKNSQTILHTFTIPRGLAVLAGGSVKIDSEGTHVFKVSSTVDDLNFPITQSNFLLSKAKTLRFEQKLTVIEDKLKYKQSSLVDIYGDEFEHSEKNTLKRID